MCDAIKMSKLSEKCKCLNHMSRLLINHFSDQRTLKNVISVKGRVEDALSNATFPTPSTNSRLWKIEKYGILWLRESRDGCRIFHAFCWNICDQIFHSSQGHPWHNEQHYLCKRSIIPFITTNHSMFVNEPRHATIELLWNLQDHAEKWWSHRDFGRIKTKEIFF
jgi:hypothetical protein